MSAIIDNQGILAWLAFLKAHSVVLEALEREMREDQHLPLTWFDVLAWLSRAPEGRLRMQVLAESIFLSHSGLTRLLDRMSAAGLVERQTCAQDRRGWYAVITPEGREVFEQAFPEHTKRVQTHFLNRLNDEDIQDLQRIMSKIIGAQRAQGLNKTAKASP